MASTVIGSSDTGKLGHIEVGLKVARKINNKKLPTCLAGSINCRLIFIALFNNFYA